jgi:4-amino-4-deoxy-L-arabinose transferase-like glycosyltransferase
VSALSPSAPAALPRRSRYALAPWWPLALLTLAAAALRLSTIDLQSFWYDEAFTPVHVLHPSLGATLHSVARTENTPPLWYVIAWVFERLFGDGEVALRLPSAFAGIALVPACWALGAELSSRRTAVGLAALATFGPLFVWYSQEARAYELFALFAAVAMLCCARAEREPTTRRLAMLAATGALALLTQYFAVFLLAPMALWLVLADSGRRGERVRKLAAIGVVAAVGAALIALIVAQGGHGTQWIGRWPLSERLPAIAQYYLTGASGEPLGHGIALLIALPLLGGCLIGLLPLLEGAPASPSRPAPVGLAEARRGAVFAALVAGGGVLLPLLLALLGADYLAPRNLIGAMVAVSALVAVLCCWPGAGRWGGALLAAGVLGLAAVSIDVDLSPRLQRGDWRGVAQLLGRGGPLRAVTTVELGSAPLEYYLPRLHNLARGRTVLLDEIDETGYSPLRSSAGQAPAPGFALVSRSNLHGLIVYRFRASRPQAVTQAALRRHVITLARPEVLVPAGVTGF